MLPAPAAAHAAEPAEKHDFPVVVDHLIQEDSDSAWRQEGDFAQGQDIPFCVVSTLPADVATRGACPYWLRVRTDAAFAMKGGSVRVALNHADGTSEDVTARLNAGFSGRTVTAGAGDVNAALPGLAPDDTFSLYYTMRFAGAYRFGHGNGNSNYAYLLYDGPSSAGGDAAGRAGLETASAEGAAPAPARALAALAQEQPAAGLASSPEVKVTAYTYSIDIEKRSESDAGLLPGACFALRDDAGEWYARGKSWTADRAGATVFETDARGRAAIVGLDADRYEVVEVSPPRHYLATGPVDVLIESDVAGQGSAMRVTSRAATVERADAAEGSVLVGVEDPEDPADPPPASGGASSGTSPAPGDRPAGLDQFPAHLAGLVPKTGDLSPAAGLGALALAAALVAAAARRKGGRGRAHDGGNQPVGAARPGTRERKER